MALVDEQKIKKNIGLPPNEAVKTRLVDKLLIHHMIIGLDLPMKSVLVKPPKHINILMLTKKVQLNGGNVPTWRYLLTET